MTVQKKGSIGSSFDSFLDDEGIRADVESLAVKEIIADQVAAAMKERGLTKAQMASTMHTTRQQLDRLLDPKNPSVTLMTLQRAAQAVGRTLSIQLS
jgi:predicted XRE-type DNA-binding protein